MLPVSNFQRFCNDYDIKMMSLCNENANIKFVNTRELIAETYITDFDNDDQYTTEATFISHLVGAANRQHADYHPDYLNMFNYFEIETRTLDTTRIKMATVFRKYRKHPFVKLRYPYSLYHNLTVSLAIFVNGIVLLIDPNNELSK